MPITTSMLYDLIACPYRVSMDLFADPSDRDEVSPFIRMLWEEGSGHGTTMFVTVQPRTATTIKKRGLSK
jgi:hypothetical protein